MENLIFCAVETKKKTGYINFDIQYIFNIILCDITTS